MSKNKRKHERVLITIPPELFDRMERLREDQGKTRSGFIQEAIDEKILREILTSRREALGIAQKNDGL